MGTNQALRDEIARLKGLPPRPPTRPTPSGMEAASERSRADPGQRPAARSRCGTDA